MELPKRIVSEKKIFIPNVACVSIMAYVSSMACSMPSGGGGGGLVLANRWNEMSPLSPRLHSTLDLVYPQW